MTPVATTKLITADEFFRSPEPANGSKQELVRGEIVTMPPPGFEHGDVQGNVYFKIKVFLQTNPRGRVILESGVKTESDPDTVRGPDISYWSFETLPLATRPKGYPDAVADLMIEIRSPEQSRRKLREKAKEMLHAGAKIVWIVDPEDRTATIYRRPDEGRELGESATITGEDVLPGFSCKVAEFFA